MKLVMKSLIKMSYRSFQRMNSRVCNKILRPRKNGGTMTSTKMRTLKRKKVINPIKMSICLRRGSILTSLKVCLLKMAGSRCQWDPSQDTRESSSQDGVSVQLSKQSMITKTLSQDFSGLEKIRFFSTFIKLLLKLTHLIPKIKRMKTSMTQRHFSKINSRESLILWTQMWEQLMKVWLRMTLIKIWPVSPWLLMSLINMWLGVAEVTIHQHVWIVALNHAKTALCR